MSLYLLEIASATSGSSVFILMSLFDPVRPVFPDIVHITWASLVKMPGISWRAICRAFLLVALAESNILRLQYTMRPSARTINLTICKTITSLAIGGLKKI